MGQRNIFTRRACGGCYFGRWWLREEDASTELAGLGGLRRSFLSARVRGIASLQNQRFVHGLERRAGRQTARWQRQQLRRDFAIQRRRDDDRFLRTRGATRSFQV